MILHQSISSLSCTIRIARGSALSSSENTCRNFRFRVIYRGRVVAAFPEVSPLPVKLRHPAQRESGGPPPAIGPEGQGTPYFINLERGIAFDRGFEQWVTTVRCYGPATGRGSLLPEYKQPITIAVYNGNGDIETVYHLARCWVTGYTAIPDPDPESRDIAVERLRLGFEHWEREPPEE